VDKWTCSVCGYIFDTDVVSPEFGLEPPYEFEDLPDDWVCPGCRAEKEKFNKK